MPRLGYTVRSNDRPPRGRVCQEKMLEGRPAVLPAGLLARVGERLISTERIRQRWSGPLPSKY
jgi:hypothetical protein